MNEKMNMNIDLRNVQDQVEDSVKNAQTFGRKAVLAYAGLWGMAFDKAQDLWSGSKDLLDKAEKRGEELEGEWLDQYKKLQAKPEVKKVVDYVEDQVDGVSKNAKSVVTEVEKFLAQFTPGKAEEVAKDVAIKVEEVMAAVIPGYDEMSAKDVVAKLPEMPKEMLIEVREYEIKNKNRVTIVREIDAMLEAPEVVAA